MRKYILVMSLVGIGFGNVASAQESFDVQAAMEQVRSENLKRSGVERQQQITSVLRKRAEDLAAIREAGFEITEDGKLQRVGPGILPMAPPPTEVMQSGVSPAGMGMEGDMSGSSASLFADPAENDPDEMSDDDGSEFSTGGGGYQFSQNVQLRGILGDSAILEINNRRTRLAEGDALPGGLVLTRIDSESVQLEGPDGNTRTYYMDWTSPVPSASGMGMGQADQGSVFMQSGAPTGGAF